MPSVRPALVLVILACFCSAARAEDPDAERTLSAFLQLWSGTGRIAPQDVARLYASRVRYYGASMSLDQVIRQKQAIARRWPSRRYSLVPGSAAERCDSAMTACTVTGVLQWTASRGGATGAKGGATVDLVLRREPDGMKIVEERGRVIARAQCREGRCGGYRLPALSGGL